MSNKSIEKEKEEKEEKEENINTEDINKKKDDDLMDRFDAFAEGFM